MILLIKYLLKKIKRLSYQIYLKRYAKYTLIECRLETGRTHQIRVHLAYIGHPIFNDPVYSKDDCTSFGQFLHSYQMNFIHPITKKEMSFECPLPQEFKPFLDQFIVIFISLQFKNLNDKCFFLDIMSLLLN